jgi:hypothetical protein
MALVAGIHELQKFSDIFTPALRTFGRLSDEYKPGMSRTKIDENRRESGNQIQQETL